MNEQQKKLVTWIGGGVVVIVLVGVAFTWGGKGGVAPVKTGPQKTVTVNGTTTVVQGEDTFRPENANALETVQGGTREVVTTEVKTPNGGETGLSKDIAIPTSVTAQKFASYRKYTMSGAGGKFVPNTIVIDARDSVEIAFTATDADYNFTISDLGTNQTIKKGEVGVIMFQGYDFGQYKITCSAAVCVSNPVGTLIVNQK